MQIDIAHEYRRCPSQEILPITIDIDHDFLLFLTIVFSSDHYVRLVNNCCIFLYCCLK